VVERLKPGRLGSASRPFALVWIAFASAISAFVVVMPVAAGLGLSAKAISVGEGLGLSAFGGSLVIGVGWAVARLLTTGVRVGGEVTEIYGYGRTQVIPSSQIRRFAVSENGAWGFLEKNDGERINLIGVNLLGPGRFRKDRCVKRLNDALAAARKPAA
jgi:hypothetical protein